MRKLIYYICLCFVSYSISICSLLLFYEILGRLERYNLCRKENDVYSYLESGVIFSIVNLLTLHYGSCMLIVYVIRGYRALRQAKLCLTEFPTIIKMMEVSVTMTFILWCLGIVIIWFALRELFRYEAERIRTNEETEVTNPSNVEISSGSSESTS